jgi:hypothetical protein
VTVTVTPGPAPGPASESESGRCGVFESDSEGGIRRQRLATSTRNLKSEINLKIKIALNDDRELEVLNSDRVRADRDVRLGVPGRGRRAPGSCQSDRHMAA